MRRAEPSSPQLGERPICLAGAEPGIQLGSERRITREVCLAVVREGPQTARVRERRGENVGLDVVGQHRIGMAVAEQLRQRTVLAWYEQRVWEELPRDLLEVAAGVHGESGRRPIDVGRRGGRLSADEHHGRSLEDRPGEGPDQRPLGPHGDTPHRHVEPPGGEVAGQLRPAEAHELEGSPGVMREPARDRHVEPGQALLPCESERRVVAARSDAEGARCGVGAETGDGERDQDDGPERTPRAGRAAAGHQRPRTSRIV